MHDLANILDNTWFQSIPAIIEDVTEIDYALYAEEHKPNLTMKLYVTKAGNYYLTTLLYEKAAIGSTRVHTSHFRCINNAACAKALAAPRRPNVKTNHTPQRH